MTIHHHEPAPDDVADVTLSGEMALAFDEYKASAKNLHEVTQKAREEIEAAQQRYRDALANFTRLSVAPEG